MTSADMSILLVAFFIYMIPTIIAMHRKHKHRAAIALFNFFLGWSGILWIVAFVWACMSFATEEQKAAILARAMADEFERREAAR
jgi:hypothetical protein